MTNGCTKVTSFTVNKSNGNEYDKKHNKLNKTKNDEIKMNKLQVT